MKPSQSDVDRVMAAFGTAPISYRPSQDVSTAHDEVAEPRPERPAGATPHTNLTPMPKSTLAAGERLAPGAGGRVREIFPLLWRAIPMVGDLRITPVTRAGDELPPVVEEEPEDESPALPAPTVAAAPAAPPLPQVADEEEDAAPVAIAPSPPIPLQSHAALIRSTVPPKPSKAAEPETPVRPAAARSSVVWPPAPRTAPVRMAPPPAAAPMAPAPVAPDAVPQPYPAYYPQAGMPWPQPGFAPPGFPPPGYPAAYPGVAPQAFVPPYTPPFPQVFGPGVHPAYPYGYPPFAPPAMPPTYGAPPPVPEPPPSAPPATPPRAPQPTNLSDIFAALHRATPPGSQEPRK